MFEWLTKAKVYETANLNRKVKFEQLLIENNIEFSISIEDLHTRNVFDSLQVSQIAVKPTNVYTFYVDKKFKKDALYLTKKI